MAHDLKIARRLVGAVAGASLVGALSMGTAGALLVERDQNSTLGTSQGVEKCVPVAVPTATVTVDANLQVSAAGTNVEHQESTTVNTDELGTVTVCVDADAAADISLDAHAVADAGLGGTTVKVTAKAVAKTAVDVNVTANGQEVI